MQNGSVARAILILPSSTYRANDFIEAARELDVDVVVASEEAQTLTEEFVLIDLRRPEWSASALEDYARESPIDAIVPVDDGGVLIAALASSRLGLVHSPPDAVAITRNKAMLRRRLAIDDVPQPAFSVSERGDDIERIAKTVGLPCVIKPLSLSGSRGVIRIDAADEAPGAADRIRRILAQAGENPNSPLLVEEYVDGEEIAWEGVLRDGRLATLAWFDKPDRMEGPFFEETIYVTPSRLPREILSDARHVVARAATAIGLTEGPVHAELRIADGGPLILELAARSIGGLCGRALRFGLLGTSLESILLRHALAMPVRSTDRERLASGVMMLPIPRAGVLRSVQGGEAALAVPGVSGLEVTVPIGHRVAPLPEGDRYLGFLFAKGDLPADVEASLRTAYSELEFTIEG